MVSLFAGVGGFDLAAQRVGIHVVAAVEVDKAARGVLADQFPNTQLFTDVTEVTGEQLIAAGFVPDRGIVTAGWPCQGNSIAGSRGGMADPRSGLWRHVVRILAETHPRWFVGENVPGLLTVNSGDDIAVVRSDLAQLGYWWAERVLDAQYTGVPQRRRRVIFVANLGDAAGPVEVLLEPQGLRGDHHAGHASRPHPATDLGYGLGVRGETGGVAHTLLARDWKESVRPEASASTVIVEVDPVSTLQGGGKRGYRVDAEASGGGISLWRPQVTGTLKAAHGGADDNKARGGQLVIDRE